MQTLGGLLLALFVAAAAALIIVGSVRAFAQELERHIPSRTQDAEAPARYFGGHADAGRGNLVRAHLHVSSRLLSSGSEKGA